MRLRARQRLKITVLVLLSLLFQQVALAAYACPLTRMPPETATMAEHCAQMGMQQAQDNPALCAKHCAPDLATAADHAQLAVPALALPPPVFVPMVLGPTGSIVVQGEIPIARSDPPPRLRYCSLLI